jgi:hypothetical protein
MTAISPVGSKSSQCPVAAAEEMSITIWRTSCSTVVREIRLLDRRSRRRPPGRAIRPTRPPEFDVGLPGTADRRFNPLDRWDDGDVIVTNDPYAGGHLPDIQTFRRSSRGAGSPSSARSATMSTWAAARPAVTMRMRADLPEGIRILPLKLAEKGFQPGDRRSRTGQCASPTRPPATSRRRSPRSASARAMERIAAKYGAATSPRHLGHSRRVGDHDARRSPAADGAADCRWPTTRPTGRSLQSAWRSRATASCSTSQDRPAGAGAGQYPRDDLFGGPLRSLAALRQGHPGQ